MRDPEKWRVEIPAQGDADRLIQMGHKISTCPEGRRFVTVSANDDRHARILVAGHLLTGLRAGSQWRQALNEIADRLTTF